MAQFSPPSGKILIVEDEFIISTTLADELAQAGYTITGEAISYEEAVELYHNDPPDLALLDIQLSGVRTGIDFAGFLRAQPDPIPFVYLTSQVDQRHLTLANETFPGGYLSKPVQVPSLLATISVALHNHQSQQTERTVTIRTGHAAYLLPVAAIRHLEADHVYVEIELTDQKPLILRRPFQNLLTELNEPSIIRVHRSHAVNLTHVTRFDNRCVYLGEKGVPISAKYREAVLTRLAAL